MRVLPTAPVQRAAPSWPPPTETRRIHRGNRSRPGRCRPAGRLRGSVSSAIRRRRPQARLSCRAFIGTAAKIRRRLCRAGIGGLATARRPRSSRCAAPVDRLPRTARRAARPPGRRRGERSGGDEFADREPAFDDGEFFHTGARETPRVDREVGLPVGSLRDCVAARISRPQRARRSHRSRASGRRALSVDRGSDLDHRARGPPPRTDSAARRTIPDRTVSGPRSAHRRSPSARRGRGRCHRGASACSLCSPSGFGSSCARCSAACFPSGRRFASETK